MFDKLAEMHRQVIDGGFFQWFEDCGVKPNDIVELIEYLKDADRSMTPPLKHHDSKTILKSVLKLSIEPCKVFNTSQSQTEWKQFYSAIEPLEMIYCASDIGPMMDDMIASYARQCAKSLLGVIAAMHSSELACDEPEKEVAVFLLRAVLARTTNEEIDTILSRELRG